MLTKIFFVFLLQIPSIPTNRIVQIDHEYLFSMFNRSAMTGHSIVSRQVRNRAGVPQSLTLLMNFRNDGTTSFQIMEGNRIIYLDNGYCKYGQLFDPTTGRCRDIFCQELNYRFNGTICVPDESRTVVNENKRMSDVDILIPITISFADESARKNFSVRVNSRMNTSCSKNWTAMFHETLQSYLQIEPTRIHRIHFCPSRTNQPRSNCSSTSEFITTSLSSKSDVKVDLRVTISDRKENSADLLSTSHVITFLIFAAEIPTPIDICKDYSMALGRVNLLSDSDRTKEEFCRAPDIPETTGSGVLVQRVRPGGHVDYVVEVPQTQTTYEAGDFMYLLIMSATQSKVDDDQTSNQNTTAVATATNATSASMVVVCNRHPRIDGRCPDGQVMRIALCELSNYTNRSIRVNRTGKLYTNREYRFDEFRPDLYVVVCKHDTYNGTTHRKVLGFMEKAPGFLSTIALILSIFALVITLMTFILFSSLRNLPGCNVINLVIALIFAQILFLCQSLFMMTRSSVCLVFAIGIHFFYLASFFWMNVMAFDLWKTFHKGFSLYLYDIRERLPYYALYAWGSPVLFVLVGIILDAGNASIKPCYGRFFRGCYDVCFRTKNDIPLQGCWIESALMRLLLFGCPVAIILIINFVFYTLTVRSIRRGVKKVRDQIERKFQRKKQVVPGEHDVKIYMRMAVLAGFGWTIGFILFVLPEGEDGFERYLSATFKYLFILLNSTPGLFIFVVYVCNRRVFNLYSQLLGQIYNFLRDQFRSIKNINFQFHCKYFLHAKNRLQRVIHGFCRKRKDQMTITSSLSTITDIVEVNNMIQMSPVDVRGSPDGINLSVPNDEVLFQ